MFRIIVLSLLIVFSLPAFSSNYSNVKVVCGEVKRYNHPLFPWHSIVKIILKNTESIHIRSGKVVSREKSKKRRRIRHFINYGSSNPGALQYAMNIVSMARAAGRVVGSTAKYCIEEKRKDDTYHNYKKYLLAFGQTTDHALDIILEQIEKSNIKN